jgi:hypothetical protein
MDTDLAPIPEQILPADSWIRAGDALSRYYQQPGRITQDELERREAEYLARGGVIQRIPIGRSAEVSEFNNRAVTTGNARHFTTDAQKVEQIAALLDTAKQKRDLPDALHCSDDKVQRLLRTYFADDPRAKPFMRQMRATNWV